MGIRIDKRLKQQLIFYTILLMLISLFVSRAVLSISLILFVILTCFYTDFISQFKRFYTTPFLVGISLLFFIPFITWFWSNDKQMWLWFARIKLPLLFFPFAFAANWNLSFKQWKWIGFWFILLVFAGCCWSLCEYLQNATQIHTEYLQAKIFDTPLENDHVRFSLVVCVAIICSVVLITEVFEKTIKILLSVVIALFIVYLHILSARTGLFAFYIFILLVIFYLIFSTKKRKWIALTVLLSIAMPVVAWFLFPTFQNRIKYNIYDLTNVSQNKYLQGSNDGNRILSLKAGWNILKEHPLGVGADVIDETYHWYDKNVPQLSEKEKLFPASEPLMYGGFLGWPGVFLFFGVMLLPFLEKVKTNFFFWLCLNIIIFFSLLFDIGLENQFGVFIYGFFVLWWWKWFQQPQSSLN